MDTDNKSKGYQYQVCPFLGQCTENQKIKNSKPAPLAKSIQKGGGYPTHSKICGITPDTKRKNWPSGSENGTIR